MLRLLQHGRAQKEPTGTASRRPAARDFAELGVLPDPADVGRKRLGKLTGVRFETVRVIEENKIQPAQRLRCRAVLDPPTHDRRYALIQRNRVGDLFERHVRRHRVG